MVRAYIPSLLLRGFLPNDFGLGSFGLRAQHDFLYVDLSSLEQFARGPIWDDVSRAIDESLLDLAPPHARRA